MYRLKVSLTLLTLVAFLTSGCLPERESSTPDAKPLPQRILFIGDSFTCWQSGLDANLKAMAESADPSLIIEAESVCIGAAPLAQHWQKGTALERIRERDRDVVVLQEDLAMYGGRADIYEDAKATFQSSVTMFDKEIRQKGARTVLYLPPTYNYELTVGFDEYRHAYESVAAEIGAIVAPVGVTWQQAAVEQPDLILYEGDGIHADTQGIYLTTAVLYAVLFERSPEGLPHLPADLLPDTKAAEDLRRQWQMSPETLIGCSRSPGRR